MCAVYRINRKCFCKRRYDASGEEKVIKEGREREWKKRREMDERERKRGWRQFLGGRGGGDVGRYMALEGETQGTGGRGKGVSREVGKLGGKEGGC